MADKFCNSTFIIRPHPVENESPYKQLEKQYRNIKVVQSGNVIPWLYAATAVLHSGCTTGIEAYLINKPAIAYVPVEDPRIGFDAELPNKLSIRCKTHEEVIQTLGKCIGNTPPAPDEIDLDYHINFSSEKLCCYDIIENLDTICSNIQLESSTVNRIYAHYLSSKRKCIKRIKGVFPNSKYNKAFQEVRFPSINPHELERKIALFANILGMDKIPSIKEVYNHIYLVQ